MGSPYQKFGFMQLNLDVGLFFYEGEWFRMWCSTDMKKQRPTLNKAHHNTSPNFVTQHGPYAVKIRLEKL